VSTRFILLLSVALLHAQTARSETYHVAQRHAAASDGNSGAANAPWKTISKAAEALRPGDTVVIHTGVYREQITPARSGTSEAPISYQAAQGEEVVITGADVITDWQRVKENIWKKEPWPFQFPTHPNNERHRLIGRCEQLIVDGTLLEQVSTREDLVAGSFCADTKADVLYVWLPDGANPNERTVEASVRPMCFGISRGREAKHHVCVRGIIFRYAANTAQRGVLLIRGDNWLVEDCTAEWTNGTGICFRGDNITLRRVRSHHNGQQGMSGSGRDFLLEEVVLDHNNTKDFDKDWEAGGIKITHARNGVVRRCRSVANNGNAFWFDIDVRDVVVERCFCKNNAGHGIYVEISGGFQIRDNLCVHNGTDDKWGYGGISIAESDHCTIEQNTCVLNLAGISIREQGPRAFPGMDGAEVTYRVHDVTIRRNICALNTKYQFGLWWDNVFFGPHPSGGPEGTPFDPDTCNIRLDHNLYWKEGKQRLALWGCPWRSNHSKYDDLVAWQHERGQDTGSLLADPLFVAPKAGDWRIRSDSPARRLPAGPANE